MDLIKERAKLLKKLEAIDILLESNESPNLSADKDDNYPVGGSYILQIEYIIKTANRFLHNSEIRSIIKANSTKKKDQEDVFLKRRVSSVLSKAKDEENSSLINIRVGNSLRNTFWGSKDWLDENGVPLKDHMYDKSKVVSKSNKGMDF